MTPTAPILLLDGTDIAIEILMAVFTLLMEGIHPLDVRLTLFHFVFRLMALAAKIRHHMLIRICMVTIDTVQSISRNGRVGFMVKQHLPGQILQHDPCRWIRSDS